MRFYLFLFGTFALFLSACIDPPEPDKTSSAQQLAVLVSPDTWDVTLRPVGISTIGTFRDADSKRCTTEGGYSYYNETIPTEVDLTGVGCAPGNVTSATLRVTYDSWQGAASFKLHKILRPWSYNTTSWTLAQTGQPWGAVGATDATDIEQTPVASMSLCASGCSDATTTVDVTALVVGWLSAPATQRGVLFRTNNIASAGQPYKSAPAHFWPDVLVNPSGNKPAGWVLADWKPRLRITCPGGLGPICGTGSIDAPEQCDDHNVNSGDGCSSTCTLESGWTCAGAPSVCVTTCGDGVKAGAETCDDGNVVDGDGCSATCGLEFGYTCVGAPSACNTTCGDGKVAGMEVCDDGNGMAGDGCAGCVVGMGWTCSGIQPSACAPVCGDGLVVGGEGCDDGGVAAEDGCSAVCSLESGWTCAGTPSTCGTVCGDGVRAGAEECDDGNLVSHDGCSATCATEICSCN